MSKHTPTPWEFSVFSRFDGKPIQTAQDVADTVAHSAKKGGAFLYGISLPQTDDEGLSLVICYTGNGPTSEANAEFIARAVNSHDDLLAALEAADAVMGALDARVNLTTLLPAGPLQVWVDAHRQVRAALEKARGTNG